MVRVTKEKVTKREPKARRRDNENKKWIKQLKDQ